MRFSHSEVFARSSRNQGKISWALFSIHIPTYWRAYA